MAIYAKTLTPEWRAAFSEYEALSGFEPMYQDDIDNKSMTPSEAWSRNVSWLEGVVADVINIKTPCDIE